MKAKRADFEILFNQTYRSVFCYALFLCKNDDMAKDVVQDAYCKAYSSIDQLRDIKNFKAWVQKIVKNRILQISIEKATFEPIETNDSYNVGKISFLTANEDSLPEKLLIRKETKEYIFHLINELNDKYRNVLILFYYYSYSYEEIADLLNINIGTVKSRIFRAKKKIHARLIKEYREEEIETSEGNLSNGLLIKLLGER